MGSVDYKAKQVRITIGKQDSYEMGTVFLSQKSIDLAQVNVSAKKNGTDTVTFDTRLYPVDINSFSKSLFTKLPGMDIDRRSGSLSFLGQEIMKLYVDGEPFFEKGPGMALEFLKSGAISKVLVYMEGKKRVVNIILKPFAKRGQFAGIEGVLGSPSFNGLQTTINAFNKKMRLGFSGLINSFGNTQVTWSPLKLIDEENVTLKKAGSIQSFLQLDNSGLGNGIPEVVLVGATYSNNWGKESVQVEYNFARSKAEISSAATEFNVLPEINTSSFRDRSNLVEKSGQDYRLEYKRKLKGGANLNITSNGFHGVYESESSSQGYTVDGSSLLTNSQSASGNAQGKMSNVGLDIDWQKKFRRQDLELSLKQSFDENRGNNDSRILTDLFENGNRVKSDTLVQQIRPVYKNYSAAFRLQHNYKISAKFKFASNLAFRNTQNTSLITKQRAKDNSFVIDSLSSSETTISNYNIEMRSALNYSVKKMNLNLGLNYQHDGYDQKELIANEAFTDSYNSFSPSFRFRYDYDRSGNFVELWYELNPLRPSIFQRQLSGQQNDPLNIFIGNPNLKQGYENSLNLQILDSDIKKRRLLSLNISASINRNAITTQSQIDEFNRSISTFINLNGNYRANADFTFTKGYDQNRTRLILRAVGYISQHANIVNDILSLNKSYAVHLLPQLNWSSSFAFIKIKPEFRYERNVYSSRPNERQSFLFQNYSVFFSKSLFEQLTFNTEFDYELRTNAGPVGKGKSFVWNAGLVMPVLKQKTLLVSLQINDILNQRLSFNRYAQDYYIKNESFNVLKRYFGVKVFYKIANKIGADQARYE